MVSVILLFTSLLTAQAAFTGSLILFPAHQSHTFCNDGSPAGYYWRTSQNTNNTNRFLIFFQSGAWCWDQASCQSRYQSTPQLMSSIPWGTTQTSSDGIFISNDWANANIAYVNYCSSDGWIGNRLASNQTYGWYFNGKNIVKAVVDDLLTKGLTTATEVLIAGCSAGGRGVLNNLDYLTTYIQQHAITGPSMKIKGLFDSAYWLEDFPPYPGQTPTTLVSQSKQIYALADAVANSGCTKLYGANYWQCGFATNVWPHIETENFYNLFLDDQWQLDQISNGAFSPPLNTDQNNYAIEFLNTTRFTLAPLTNSNQNYFAASCWTHCSTESSNYYNIQINGLNLDQVISNWFFQDQSFQLVDTCSTFKCGTGCP